jgi:hypothetical protein
LLKVDAPWFLKLSGRMTVILCIERLTQIPLLKKILAEEPGRAITGKNTLDREAKAFAGIEVQALYKCLTRGTLKNGASERARGIEPKRRSELKQLLAK